MELTPQEQADAAKLDKDLPNTETIKRIYENQETMIKGLEDEREFNKSEFEKGSEKFREIFSELKDAKAERKELREEVSEMKEDYKKGVKEIVDTIQNKELSDLRDEVRDSKIKEKDFKIFWNGVAKTILSAVVIAIVLYALSKLGLVAP